MPACRANSEELQARCLSSSASQSLMSVVTVPGPFLGGMPVPTERIATPYLHPIAGDQFTPNRGGRQVERVGRVDAECVLW